MSRYGGNPHGPFIWQGDDIRMLATGSILDSDGNPIMDTLPTGFTPESVIFVGADGSLDEDASNFFYNKITKTLVAPHLEITPFIAEETDEHALFIDVDANGFADVKANEIVYKADVVGAGNASAISLTAIDASNTTGGDLIGHFITEVPGLAEVYGIGVGVGVNPIVQASGGFVDMDSALVDGVDERAALITDGTNIPIFVDDNDTVILGHATKFDQICIVLVIGASGAGVAPVFRYSTGVGTWSSFTPIDSTNGFRNSGVIMWFIASIPGWLVGAGSEFLIEITRTRNMLTTVPTESFFQIAGTTQFRWDKDANVLIRSLDVAGHARSIHQSLFSPSGTTQTVDFTNGNSATVDLESASGNVTVTVDGMQEGGSYLLKAIQGATERTITITGIDDWFDCPGPVVMPPTENSYVIITITKLDGVVSAGWVGVTL